MKTLEDRLGKLEARVRRFLAIACLLSVGLIGAFALEAFSVPPASSATESGEVGSLRVESGTLVIDREKIWKLGNPKGCAGHRGIKSGVVKFAERFQSPPEVVVGLTTFDFTNDGADLRMWLAVDEVTEDSFVYTFTTWCDTSLAYARATWMAVGG